MTAGERDGGSTHLYVCVCVCKCMHVRVCVRVCARECAYVESAVRRAQQREKSRTVAKAAAQKESKRKDQSGREGDLLRKERTKMCPASLSSQYNPSKRDEKDEDAQPANAFGGGEAKAAPSCSLSPCRNGRRLAAARDKVHCVSRREQ